MWITPAARLRHSIRPVATPGSQSPQLLASGHMSTLGHSSTPVGPDHLTCMSRADWDSPNPPVADPQWMHPYRYTHIPASQATSHTHQLVWLDLC